MCGKILVVSILCIGILMMEIMLYWITLKNHITEYSKVVANEKFSMSKTFVFEALKKTDIIINYYNVDNEVDRNSTLMLYNLFNIGISEWKTYREIYYLDCGIYYLTINIDKGIKFDLNWNTDSISNVVNGHYDRINHITPASLVFHLDVGEERAFLLDGHVKMNFIPSNYQLCWIVNGTDHILCSDNIDINGYFNNTVIKIYSYDPNVIQDVRYEIKYYQFNPYGIYYHFYKTLVLLVIISVLIMVVFTAIWLGKPNYINNSDVNTQSLI